MDAGELVPDEVILGLVRDALGRADARDGAIFDGYPRNVAQAESLTAMLDELGRTLDAVVLIDVAGESLVRRLSGRRTDPETGAVYHWSTTRRPQRSPGGWCSGPTTGRRRCATGCEFSASRRRRSSPSTRSRACPCSTCGRRPIERCRERSWRSSAVIHLKSAAEIEAIGRPGPSWPR
jgi:adenylate kinase family enzyme